MGFDEAKSNSSQVKRKERAKLAARLRRSQEATVIKELACELSIPSERAKRVDKAMIVKLSVDYLRARQALVECPFDVAVTRLELLLTSDQPALRERTAGALSSVDPNCATFAPPSITPSNTTLTTAKTHTTIAKTITSTNNSTASAPTAIVRSSPTAKATLAVQQASYELSLPKFSTQEIFAPKTNIDDVESHFLILSDNKGRTILELDNDADLTHLAPRAGDTSILIEVEPLDGIEVDCLFEQAPACKHSAEKSFSVSSQTPVKLKQSYVQQQQTSANCDRKRIGLLWHKQNN